MEKDNRILLTVAGDIAFNSNIVNKLNGQSPLHSIIKKLNSDISIANCECVLSHENKKRDTWVNIKSTPESAAFLKPFSVLCLANNHIMDFGVKGLHDTKNALAAQRILSLGAGDNFFEAIKPLIINVNSRKVAIINFMITGDFSSKLSLSLIYQAGPALYDEKVVIELIRNVRKFVDIIIISIHWGLEYIYLPHPKQQVIGRKLIDNGADLIVGHHPHVVQGIEKYKNGLILYSLGNLCFDRSISNVSLSMIVKIFFSEGKILDFAIYPIAIAEDGLPFFVKNPLKDRFLRFIEEISLPLYPAVTEPSWFEYSSPIYLKAYKKSNINRIRKNGAMAVPFLLGLVTPYLVKHYSGYIRHKLRQLTNTKI